MDKYRVVPPCVTDVHICTWVWLLSFIIQPSIMADEQPEFVPSPEGPWILDDTGKNLKFLSEEELKRNASETTDTTISRAPPAVITNYFSTLTPPQKKMQDGLRGWGWNNAAIHNWLTIIEAAQYNCAKLRQKRYTEFKIQRLDALGNQHAMDFSYLKRGLSSTADEDYQLQLYLLEEVKRRRLIMLEEDGLNSLLYQ